MTRTFVVGEPPRSCASSTGSAKEALDRSLAACAPGVAGARARPARCELFEAAGYPTLLSKEPGEVLKDGFYHSLGHGVGLEVHEQPSSGAGLGEPSRATHRRRARPLPQGYGGCRLEDLVLVTEDGAENLTEYPYDLAP